MSSKAVLFAGVLLSASLPAFADSGVEFLNNEIGYQFVHVTPSKTTRAQVLAELHGAQNAASIPRSFEFPAPEKPVASTLTREQVQRAAAGQTRGQHEAKHRLYGPVHALGS